MNSAVTTQQYREKGRTPSFLDKLARTTLFKLVAKIKHGQITVQDGDKTWVFGDSKELTTKVTINTPAFYRKCFFGGSIGAGEAYIDKMWETDNLPNLVRILVRNMSLLDKMEEGFAWLLRPANLLTHILNSNSKKGAKRNILAHYDLGNTLYKSFLDPTMMYSSAIYPKATSSLEEASLNKLETICQKLGLKKGDRVIEIGTGWGGFAIYAASHYGCHVTTTTISKAQYEEAQKRVSAAGLEDKITLLQKDYRDLKGQFDKLVSIEMIEAVGHRYLPNFFKKCGELLKPDGKMLLQAITIVDQKYKQYVNSVDFIQKHVFPGGCLPSNTRMLQLFSEKTDLIVRRLDDFGFDYARTLQDWRKRFSKAYSALAPKGYDETFRRFWEFYLCYCEGGFLERSISVVHVVAAKPGNRDA